MSLTLQNLLVRCASWVQHVSHIDVYPLLSLESLGRGRSCPTSFVILIRVSSSLQIDGRRIEFSIDLVRLIDACGCFAVYAFGHCCLAPAGCRRSSAQVEGHWHLLCTCHACSSRTDTFQRWLATRSRSIFKVFGS